MSQEQSGLGKISGLGVVAAFGLITMSSSLVDKSITTLSISPPFHYEKLGYFYGEETVYNSSMLSKQAIGDILSFDKGVDFVQKHEKIKVNLQITRISKHISNFDFEDEYEEI